MHFDIIQKLESHTKKCTPRRLKPSSVSFTDGEKEIQEPRATRVKNRNSLLLMLGEGSGMRVDEVIAGFCV
jgi:hypothetical protein